jgi:hypothetical protein
MYSTDEEQEEAKHTGRKEPMMTVKNSMTSNEYMINLI